MSEADERVCLYAVILTDAWEHLQKGSNDTEMRPCTKSYVILEANEGNRDVVSPLVRLQEIPSGSSPRAHLHVVGMLRVMFKT